MTLIRLVQCICSMEVLNGIIWDKVSYTVQR